MSGAKAGLGHRQDDLERSTALIAIATEAYFRAPAVDVARQDVETAVRLGKPIIVLLRRGVVPPDGFFPPRAVILEWSDRAEIARLAVRVRAELHLAGAIADPRQPVDVVDGPTDELPGQPWDPINGRPR